MTAALAWLTGSTWGRYIAAGILIAGSVLAALAAAFARGEKAQALQQQASQARATATAVRVNREIQQMPVSERREALRKWSRG